MRTQVGIVGAGPAGLMLSHLLHLYGIESAVIDIRSRESIEGTVRAGILEQNTVDMMTNAGVDARMKLEGIPHHGIELRFNGRGHRIDFTELANGRGVMVYAQHEVLIDLIKQRINGDEGPLLFGVSDVSVSGIPDDMPIISFTQDGSRQQIECDYVVGADGSQTYCRFLIPEGKIRKDYFRQYPFAWFGILAKAPPSSDELIYTHHERGFALISTRSPDVQRMYFQCDPDDSVENWSDDKIWNEFQTRVSGPGVEIKPGEIFQKDILQFRSFVCEPMQYGKLFLAGDAAHTVPPTGAKGLNLAMADVHVLARALGSYYASKSAEYLDAYTATALRRVWRAQHFSWWMTSMLHRFSDASDFDLHRQLAELDVITSSRQGSALLAEQYVGYPLS
jgi:p-hydroxybenzoate 3-monooxygenase